MPLAIRYVPDQYKTQKLCDTFILENGGTLKFATRIKNCITKLLITMLMHQNLSLIAIRLNKMFNKAFDTCLFVFDSVRD